MGESESAEGEGGEKKKIVLSPTIFAVLWILHLLCTVAFIVSSCFVADNSNAGFNVILTGFLFLGYGVWALMLINPKAKGPPTQFAVGFILGNNILVAFLALMTAIYWGELSRCNPPEKEIKHFTCDDVKEMKCVCAFSSIIFVLAAITGPALSLSKDEIMYPPETDDEDGYNALDEEEGYDQY